MSIKVLNHNLHFPMDNPLHLDDIIILTQTLITDNRRRRFESTKIRTFIDNNSPEYKILFPNISYFIANNYSTIETADEYETLWIQREYIDQSEAFDTIYAFMQQCKSYVFPNGSEKFKYDSIAFVPIHYQKQMETISTNVQYEIYKNYLFHLLDERILSLSKIFIEANNKAGMNTRKMNINIRNIYGKKFIDNRFLKADDIRAALGISATLYRKLLKDAFKEYITIVNTREAIKESEFGQDYFIDSWEPWYIGDDSFQINILPKSPHKFRMQMSKKSESEYQLPDLSKVDIPKDMVIGKSEYSELIIDTACKVIYAITGIYDMKNKLKLINKFNSISLPLLSLNVTEKGKQGIPIIVQLDEETNFELLVKGIKILASPILREINKISDPISLSFDLIKETNQVLIGVIYHKED